MTSVEPSKAPSRPTSRAPSRVPSRLVSRKEGSKELRKEAAKTTSDRVAPSSKKAPIQPDESDAAAFSSRVVSSPSDSSRLPVQESVYAVIEHGQYQRRILMCGVLGVTAIVMEVLAYRVIARPVDHWCQPPVDLAYLSDDVWKNRSIPVDPDGNFSRCTVYTTDEQGTSPENRTVKACHRWDYDIDDHRDSIVSRFELVCGRAALHELSARLPSLAYALLSPAAGFAADRLGRKPVTWVCGSIVLISAVGSSVAVNYAFFLTNRIVLLASGSSTYLLTFMLIYEATGNARRWPYTLLHSAVALTLVPPFLHVLALFEPSWALAHAIFIVPMATFTVWCFLLHESPVWLLATWRVQEAEACLLAAAKLNGVDDDKAKQGLRALRGKLTKLRRSHDPAPALPVSGGILEVAKMRRRAAATFFSRFTMSGIFFGLMFTDRAFGLYWHAVHVVFSAICYSLIIWAMNRLGLRDTLSALLAATSVTAVAKAFAEYGNYDDAVAYLQAALKILASGCMSVVLCYAGEIFPTAIRGTGVSLSVFAGGIGSLLGVFLIRVRTVRPGFVFDVFYTGMTLLSIVAVQWLPELFIEKKGEETRSADAMSPEERKMALKASLSPRAGSKERKQRDAKAKAGGRSLS